MRMGTSEKLRRDLVVLLHAHQPNALRRSAYLPDLARIDSLPQSRLKHLAFNQQASTDEAEV